MNGKFYLSVIVLPIIISTSFCMLNPINNKIYEQNQQENSVLYTITADHTRKLFPTVLSEEDFIIKNDNTHIELGNNFTKLKTDEEIINIRYFDEKHVYNIYTYKNFILSTQPFDEGVVFRIYLTTPSLKTSRGIGVGDTIFDIFERYGLNDESPSKFLDYHHNGKVLIFYFNESGVVTSILFELI